MPRHSARLSADEIVDLYVMASKAYKSLSIVSPYIRWDNENTYRKLTGKEYNDDKDVIFFNNHMRTHYGSLLTTQLYQMLNIVKYYTKEEQIKPPANYGSNEEVRQAGRMVWFVLFRLKMNTDAELMTLINEDYKVSHELLSYHMQGKVSKVCNYAFNHIDIDEPKYYNSIEDYKMHNEIYAESAMRDTLMQMDMTNRLKLHIKIIEDEERDKYSRHKYYIEESSDEEPWDSDDDDIRDDEVEIAY